MGEERFYFGIIRTSVVVNLGDMKKPFDLLKS